MSTGLLGTVLLLTGACDTSSSQTGPSIEDELAAIDTGAPLPETEASMKAVADALGERGIQHLLNLDWAHVTPEDVLLDPVLFDAIQAVVSTSEVADATPQTIGNLPSRPQACTRPTCGSCSSSLSSALEKVKSVATSNAARNGALTCFVAGAAFAGSWTGFGAVLGGYALAKCVLHVKTLAQSVSALIDEEGCAIAEATPQADVRLQAATELLDDCSADCAYLSSRVGVTIVPDDATGRCRYQAPVQLATGGTIRGHDATAGLNQLRFSVVDSVSSLACAPDHGLFAGQVHTPSDVVGRLHLDVVDSGGAATELIGSDVSALQIDAGVETARCGPYLYYAIPKHSGSKDSELRVRHVYAGTDNLVRMVPGRLTGLACRELGVADGEGDYIPYTYYGVEATTATGFAVELFELVGAVNGSDGGIPRSLGKTIETNGDASEGVVSGPGSRLDLAYCDYGASSALYFQRPTVYVGPTIVRKSELRAIDLAAGATVANSRLLASEDLTIVGVACDRGDDPRTATERVFYGVTDRDAADHPVSLKAYDGGVITEYGQVFAAGGSQDASWDLSAAVCR